MREVTDKPIRFLVNSNYHGDHTFGNCAFPMETLIIQQRETAARVPFMKEEKAFFFPCVGNKPEIFEGVTLRLPDIVFNELPPNRPGGTGRRTPLVRPCKHAGGHRHLHSRAKVAWTGNLTGGGTFSLAIESDAPTFMETLVRFVRALDVETLIPGHSPLSGPSVLWRDMVYYARVTDGVKRR